MRISDWSSDMSPSEVHKRMSLCVAALAIAGTRCCFRTAAIAPFHYGSDQVRLGRVGKMKLLAGNRPFVLLLVSKLLQLTALAVTQAAMPFLFKQILHFTATMLGLYFLVFYKIGRASCRERVCQSV